MGKLFNLYWPGIKPGFIISALYPLAAYIVAAIVQKYSGYQLDWLLHFPVIFLLCASPLMLTKRDKRSACAKLHVNSASKLCFLILIFWIVVPAIILTSLLLGQFVSYAIFGIQIPLAYLSLQLGQPDVSLNIDEVILSYIVLISIVTVVLFYVVKVKNNRVLAGLLTPIVMIFLIPIFGGLTAVVLYLFGSFNIAQTGAIDSFQQYPLWIFYGVVTGFAIVGIIYFIKLCKRLRNSGF